MPPNKTGEALKEFSLHPFEKDPVSQLFRVDATLARVQSTVVLRWMVYGPTEKLLLEEAETELWKHTCFEFFLLIDEKSYLEWNFAPQGHFEAFHFSNYRERAKVPSLPPDKAIKTSECSKTSNRLIHEVELSLEYFPHWTPKGSMTVVLEATDKSVSHWAFKHPPQKPDFHLSSLFSSF